MAAEFDYDQFIAEVEKARDGMGEPCWIIAKSVEHAEALAAWCIQNGIEEPRIVIG